MKNLLPILAMLIFTPLFGQDKALEIKTNQGNIIQIDPLYHGTVGLTKDDYKILVDPFGASEILAAYQSPDLILITDIHGDHFNEKALSSVFNSSKTKILAPKAVYDKMNSTFRKNTDIINNFESVEILSTLSIETIPMYNLPESDDSRHTKGRGNGYILNWEGKRIYISGDTEDIQEMRDLKNIDIAFVCMNLPYTMDVDAAADAVIDFEPKVVVPYHYRGGERKMSDTDKFKSLVNTANPKIKVILLDFYPVTP
jgi:L-ascorbate metabolism protein UlaG (beta-lactamase superfamily)